MIWRACRLVVLLGLLIAMVIGSVKYRRGIVPLPDYEPGNLPPWPKRPLVGPPFPTPYSPPLPPAKVYTGIDTRHLPFMPDLESTGQFKVLIELEDPGDPKSIALAKEVQRALERARPENPSRMESFPTWKTNDPLHPELIPLGWYLSIKRVKRLSEGNWRAVVFANPICTTKERNRVRTLNHHIEYYRYVDGVLEFVGDEIDPYFGQGIFPIVRPEKDHDPSLRLCLHFRPARIRTCGRPPREPRPVDGRMEEALDRSMSSGDLGPFRAGWESGMHRLLANVVNSTLCTAWWLALALACPPLSARADNFVVDAQAPGAADTNPGTTERPFRTIQRAVDRARPGDTVFVMAGNYDERVQIRQGGAEGQPITLTARPWRSAVVRGFDVHASFVRIEGFEITALHPATAVQLHGAHCEILDNAIHDMMTAVAGTTGEPTRGTNRRDYSAVAHHRIAYNKVDHCQYGFMLGGNDWLVENNEVNRLFMYTPGNRYDDCDYTRFFGKGCVQRYNYYHGSIASEIRTAHVDCLQTFTVNGESAEDLVFDDNVCFDFHQMCMVESTSHIGSVRNWTFRRNIISTNSKAMSGGWGPDIIQTQDVTIDHNTISNVRWATIGLRGKESTGGRIRNNILCHAERAVIAGDGDFTASAPLIEFNLTFDTSPAPGATNLNGKDPLFVAPSQRNFRLRQGSPAIAAGPDGTTLGALPYPNVYYVDPRHPAAADEPGWGYPAVPLKTLARACDLARTGETIVLRGGVYRETLRPACDGVTIRAMPGETVTISGADLIEGWRREADGGWSAELPSLPAHVLRDGQPWSKFAYDGAAKRMIVNSGDPRLHVYEAVVRRQAVDKGTRQDVKIEGIAVANTTSAPEGTVP